mgnify:CR=1 FL=1
MSDLKIKAKKINERIAENYTKIKIEGTAEIVYGDNVIKCRNKFTRYLMSSIVVFIANANAYAGEYGKASERAAGMSCDVTARIGTDTSTYTSPDMSDLVDKVDKAPNSITRRLIKEPDYSLYIAEFVFQWNAGTLPDIYEGATGENEIDGKVGEFGVYLRTDRDDWSSPLSNPNRGCNLFGEKGIIPLGPRLIDSSPGVPVRLASRIASADDAFDAFEFYGSIDPLTFKWRFQVAIV